MSRLKPFEFGKSITHSRSEVGSFLSFKPIKSVSSGLKYLVVGGLLLFFVLPFLGLIGSFSNSFVDALSDSFSKPSFPKISLFEPSIEDLVEKLKAEQTNALPKLETAIAGGIINGEWIVLDEVRFATGTARLMDARQLNPIATLLIANPNVVIKIGGFTDNTGNNEQNLQLSIQRAVNVAQKLAALGVSGENLYYEGFGSSMPLCSEELSESCKSINRRIAIQILSK